MRLVASAGGSGGMARPRLGRVGKSPTGLKQKACALLSKLPLYEEEFLFSKYNNGLLISRPLYFAIPKSFKKQGLARFGCLFTNQPLYSLKSCLAHRRHQCAMETLRHIHLHFTSSSAESHSSSYLTELDIYIFLSTVSGHQGFLNVGHLKITLIWPGRPLSQAP